MAATPDHILLEVLVEKLHGPVSQCSTAIRSLISHSELAVESLERIVDDVNRHNKFIQAGRVLGISCIFVGSVLAILGVEALFYYNGEIFPSIYAITFGPFFMAFGTCFARYIILEANDQIMGIMESQVVPLIKKLIGSNDEFQTQWRGVVGACTSTADQITWLSYLNSLDTSISVITDVKSLTVALHSIQEFLKGKKHTTAQRIINQLLPWLQQQTKELKNAEQQLNKITTLISEVITDNNSS